ncbi:hypothetical protein ACHAXR_007114 [Thalassiosira sp. AJA248-18]
MHPIQSSILEMNWSYSGWQADMELFGPKILLVPRVTISSMTSCPHQLDQLHISYPGWETDVEDAKKCLREHGYNGWPHDFDMRVKGMKNKRAIYNGNRVATLEKVQTPKYKFGTCAICLEAPRTHIFVPCGHGQKKKMPNLQYVFENDNEIFLSMNFICNCLL